VIGCVSRNQIRGHATKNDQFAGCASTAAN
jgi:hypothetical protein